MLDADERTKVQQQINNVSQSLLNGKTAFHENASIPYLFNLKDGMETSFFLIKTGTDTRMVAAIDEAPIFDKISLTLFRAVDKENANEAYRMIGESTYKQAGLL